MFPLFQFPILIIRLWVRLILNRGTVLRGKRFFTPHFRRIVRGSSPLRYTSGDKKTYPKRYDTRSGTEFHTVPRFLQLQPTAL